MSEPALPARRWHAGELLSTAFVVAYLLVQTVIPLAGLARQRPARVAWHMFSTIPPSTAFALVLDNGTTQTADLSPYIGLSRGELQLDDALPPHLCQLIPALAFVQVTRSGGIPRVYACP
jgi:hypothetical protein